MKDAITILFWNIFLNIRFWYWKKYDTRDFSGYMKRDPHRDGMDLTFIDEFKFFDRNVWRTDAYYGMRFHPGSIIDQGKAPREYYDDSCLEVSNNVLHLKAERKPIKVEYEGKEYTIQHRVGQIDSSNTFMQHHGYFEIRSRMPKSRGMWPAFWMASIAAWPPEIDIYEIYTGNKKGFQRFASNAHWGTADKKKMKPKTHDAFDLSRRFYTYGVDWSERYLKFYFQDRLIRVMKTPKDFIHPMHIIINTSIDDRYSNQEFPNYCDVDFVRAYKHVDI